MKLGINKSNRNVFYYKGYICSDELLNIDIDIILSCEFYWVRKFKIPAKSNKEALKTLPALFEDIIPASSYDYDCIKVDENEFLCFAYDNKKVLEELKKSKFNLSNIKSIRFAQLELAEYYDKNLFVNDKLYTYKNGILLKVPFFIEQNDELDISKLINKKELTSKKIDFKFYSSIFNKKLIFSLSVITALLVSVNVLKYISLNNEVNNLETQKQNLKDKYNLPQTSFQMNSIIKEYSDVLDKQDKLKNLITDLFRFKKYSSSGKLLSLTVKNKKVSVSYENIKTTSFRNYLSKKYKVLKINTKNNKTQMELTYE